MKTIIYTLIGLFTLTMFSCSTSNDVVNNGLIQKRKYRKGFYIDKKTSSYAIANHESSNPNLNTASLETTNETKTEDRVLKVFETNTEEEEKFVKSETTLSNQSIQEGPIHQDKTNHPSNTHELVNKTLSKKYEIPYQTTEKSKQVNEERNFTDFAPTEAYNSNGNAVIGLLLLVIITILLPWLGVLLATGDATKTLLCVLLWLLGYIPGLIYGLIVVLGAA